MIKIIISKYEQRTGTRGKYYLLTTSAGTMGCFDAELFPVIEGSLHREIEAEIQTKGKYTSLVKIGQGGGNALAHEEGHHQPPHSTHPPQEKDWEKINQRTDREVDIHNAINGAVSIAAHSCNNLPTKDQMVIVTDLTPQLIALAKKMRKEYTY